MTNEKLFDLTDELLDRMETAKKEAKKLEVKPEDEEFAFVHIGKKEYVNPKFLPFEYHYQIVQLDRFIKEHDEIKQEDLNMILSMCKTRFAVLVDVNKVVSDLVKEIRTHHDEKYIPYLYFGLKQNEEKEKRLGL